MPWRDLLSLAQRTQLLALPTTLREFEEFYTLTPTDREFVAARRTATNRLGIAVQLCFLRHPGRAWIPKEVIPMGMLRYIASQIEVTADDFEAYADRDETRREHLADLLVELGLRTLGVGDYRTISTWLTEHARGTDNGMALVSILIAEIRQRKLVVPALSVVERLVLGARARARSRAFAALIKDLTPDQQKPLDGILETKGDSHQTHLGWVRQSTGAASPVNILDCLERLKFLRG